MSVRHLDFMFRPQSVAVIGASQTSKSIGGIVMRNLLRSNFGGPIMPVNPKYSSVAGVLTYPDIASLPVTPDLAIICTGPKTLPGIVQQLGERGTRSAAVITAGLTRENVPDGRTIQQAMLDAAKPYCLRLLGPNCVGLLIPKVGLNATFAHTKIETGSLAFVSQSGGFCTATLDWAKARGIGFSHFISLGDSADVDFGDVLDYLGSEPDTKAILLYMESIGADEARKFMSAARAAARNKPVLAIKAGRNEEGARAAASHTGALAGADNVYDAALRRAGILRVFDLDELFDAVETLARSRPLEGERLAILTNGGGPGVIATDALIADGGQLAQFSQRTMAALDKSLPDTWSHGNPVDMVGDSDATTYVNSLNILCEDPNVDAILVMNAPSALAPPEDSARGIIDVVRNAKVPILTSWLGGEEAGRARRLFLEAGIPTFNTPENAVRAFMHMMRYRRNQEILTQVPPSAPTDFSHTPEVAKKIVDTILAEGRDLLTEPEAKQVLASYGIPVVETRVAATPEEAATVAGSIGFPVAIKILSPDISHKSDVGGVALGLESMEEVRSTAKAMLTRVGNRFPDASITGFTVQAMACRPQAHELIVGMTTDSMFGPVILFGRGGTAVEVIGDRAVALPPLNMSLARHLISRTEVCKLLEGYRDRPPVDFDAISLTLIQVSQLIVDRPEIVELDINPLFADDRGVIALDARIRVETPCVAGPKRLAIRPYPRELEETITLSSGQEVFVRPIRPEDQPAHEEFISRLSKDDLRLRFLGVIRDIPASEMSRLTQIDYDRDMAFVATALNDKGVEETLGVVRIVSDPDETCANFAVMTRTDLKRTGLGTALMWKMIAYCKSRGMKKIVGEMLTENKAVRQLTLKLGFTAEDDPETGRTRVTLNLV